MSSSPAVVHTTTSSTLADQSRQRVMSVAIWLGASAIAVFFALLLRDSTIIDGVYLPRGNDSFYHVRRILEAVIGRGFYEFDERLHAPDGSWVPWPWGYDYLMAKATQVALWLFPQTDPVAFMSYVPVFWVLVNAALFAGVAARIGLSLEMRMLAMLCFALSPLTQLLHSIGMVDHHYVEHTFVLLNVLLGLRWLEHPDRWKRAALLGAALGTSQAFHNGLFILQLVPLVSVFVLWLRRATPPARSLTAFAIALLVTTQLVLLPSEPYRRGMFEFGLLSWFHFYVAICTAAAMLFFAKRPRSTANLWLFAGMCIALVAPLAAQLQGGALWMSGKLSILDRITEARSPYKLIMETFGFMGTLGWYSWLLLAAPLLLAYYGYRVLRERTPNRLFYAVAVTFGLALLLDQFRLHYYGFFGLITGALLIVDELSARLRWHRGAVFVATFAAVVAIYQPPLRQLFVLYAPGADSEYASALQIFLDLRTLCAQDPGVVLASPDDGSAILFHSQCSVIANNFILTKADAEHIEEIDRLNQLSPAEVRAQRPDIKYIFLRARDFSSDDGGSIHILETNPTARQLLLDPEPPPGFKLVKTVLRKETPSSEAQLYARLYKVTDD